jgi:hypothetical protein
MLVPPTVFTDGLIDSNSGEAASFWPKIGAECRSTAAVADRCNGPDE